MKILGPVLSMLVAAAAAASAAPAALGAPLQVMTDEERYCGIHRDSTGKIIRSPAIVRDFRNVHPCPATGKTDGACAGWAIDHVVPLECGGCDAVSNMQWLPDAIKSCAGTVCKDRWEKRVYCAPPA